MKIILSRKGFDSQYGKQPSPILPDGTLLSLPIPYLEDIHTYTQLCYKDKNYLDIIRGLKPGTAINEHTTCHLDPDIRKDIFPREHNWKPLFGQYDAAQGHLKNNQVAAGDVFLFFGWFRQTQAVGGRLYYSKACPGLHILYGYLQIGEVYRWGDVFPDYARNHTHMRSKYYNKKSNCIYVASDFLSLDPRLQGAGCFCYHNDLVLTKPGMTRGRWLLPDFFRELKISYHTPRSFREDYFQSVAQGQEFVIECNDQLLNWTREIIELGCNQVITAS